MTQASSPSGRFSYRDNNLRDDMGPNVIDHQTGRVWSMGLCTEFADLVSAHRTDTPPLSPTNPTEIAACLRDLSRRMLACGTAMDFYGDKTMQAHGLEMIGAAGMAARWAQAIEDGRT